MKSKKTVPFTQKLNIITRVQETLLKKLDCRFLSCNKGIYTKLQEKILNVKIR